ncbi:MAG: metal-dependent hydrolase [Vicinamibacterales bacterium]|nr:metal-dependent hydrolase [Vicinamibacterales bacterium]HJO37323.1 metal-dependent hydrolase [Vicinamibacterales bacterium]
MGGVVGGLAAARPGGVAASQSAWRAGTIFGLLGIAPDLDFLVGAHSSYTHSLGATILVGLAAWALFTPRSVPFALACAAAWGSHLLLDWLGTDGSVPIGVMALWPFDDGYYLSSAGWFLPIHRDFAQPGIVAHTFRAIAWELLLLGPIAAAAVWFRRR